MLTHNGQAVCTDCYHLRKPVELKPRPRRKASRKRNVVIIAAIIAAVLIGLAVVHWAF
jgi:uncharacterized membrane protein